MDIDEDYESWASEKIQKLINQNYQLTTKVAELEAALRSIAKNTCCDTCQEAKLVALNALEKK